MAIHNCRKHPLSTLTSQPRLRAMLLLRLAVNIIMFKLTFFFALPLPAGLALFFGCCLVFFCGTLGFCLGGCKRENAFTQEEILTNQPTIFPSGPKREHVLIEHAH